LLNLYLDFHIGNGAGEVADLHVEDTHFIVGKLPFQVGVDDGKLFAIRFVQIQGGPEEGGEDMDVPLVPEDPFEDIVESWGIKPFFHRNSFIPL
jgi:hypothetical protein